MPVDMEGLLGVENMTVDAKAAVIAIIKNLPTNNLEKRFLFARWARLVGFHATGADVDQVALWAQP